MEGGETAPDEREHTLARRAPEKPASLVRGAVDAAATNAN